MTDAPRDGDAERLVRGILSDAPFKTAVARVNIPDPHHPGMRIVGYRVSKDEAGLSDGLFVLQARDAALREAQAAERETIERCALIADRDAEEGRGDLDDPVLDGLAGSRILAAERIAFLIRILADRAPDKWRHKKRGTTYEIVGEASSQVVGESIGEGDTVVVYRADSDGSLWVRRKDEFYDGRFERVPQAECGDEAIADRAPEAGP